MNKPVVVSVVCLLLSSLLLSGCGCGGKYAEVKKLNAEFVQLTEAYVADLDKADSAQDVAKAMDRFTDNMKEFAPMQEKLAEKYPELKDESQVPEELQQSMAEAEEIGMKMGQTMMKIMPYMNDPDVKKAQQRMMVTLSSQQPGDRP